MRFRLFLACALALCTLETSVLADGPSGAAESGNGQATSHGPVFWFKGDPTFLDSVSGTHGTPHGDVRIGPGVTGSAVWFDGVTSGVSFPDMQSMKLTGSLSVSVWVYVTAYPPGSNLAGQILFRGDDRNGLDPFTLDIRPDGQYQFHIEGNNSTPNNPDSDDLYYHAALNQWTQLTGTYDAVTGAIRLYVDGERVAEDVSLSHPFAELDPNSIPGIGVGDNQGFGKSGYHERFSGGIEDLRVYDISLSPAAIRNAYNVRVRPAELLALASNVSSGDSTTIRLLLNAPAPAGGLVINLSSSSSQALSAPASVTVPAGAAYVDFSVQAAHVGSPIDVVVTGSTSGGVSKSVTLHIRP